MTASEVEIIKHHIKREELQQQWPTKTNRMQLYKRVKCGFQFVSSRVLSSVCRAFVVCRLPSLADNNSSAMGQREIGPSPAVLDRPLSRCVQDVERLSAHFTFIQHYVGGKTARTDKCSQYGCVR